jgi:hypothetical protein
VGEGKHLIILLQVQYRDLGVLIIRSLLDYSKIAFSFPPKVGQEG